MDKKGKDVKVKGKSEILFYLSFNLSLTKPDFYTILSRNFCWQAEGKILPNSYKGTIQSCPYLMNCLIPT